MSSHTLAAALSTSVIAALAIANVNNHVSVTLSFKASTYSRLSTYFKAICGKFEVMDHIDDSPTHPNDALWVQ